MDGNPAKPPRTCGKSSASTSTSDPQVDASRQPSSELTSTRPSAQSPDAARSLSNMTGQPNRNMHQGATRTPSHYHGKVSPAQHSSAGLDARTRPVILSTYTGSQVRQNVRSGHLRWLTTEQPLAYRSAGRRTFSLTFPVTQRDAVYRGNRCRPSTWCGVARPRGSRRARVRRHTGQPGSLLSLQSPGDGSHLRTWPRGLTRARPAVVKLGDAIIEIPGGLDMQGQHRLGRGQQPGDVLRVAEPPSATAASRSR